MGDMDDDFFPDLIISGDFGTSQMLWNQRNKTFYRGFFNVIEDLMDNSMGCTVGDWDQDGKTDIMFTSVSISSDEMKGLSKVQDGAGMALTFAGNHLYRNLGERRFIDVTDDTGIRESGWGWGPFFFDFDNDGDLDILNGNGMDDPETTDDDWAINQPMRLYVNQGEEEDFRFVEEGKLRQIASTEENRASIAWDYDQDGDLDVFVVNHGARPQLFRNDGGNYYDFLRVKVLNPYGTESIGALVTVQVYEGGVEDETADLIREIGSSAAFLGEGERVAHFGLGKLPANFLIHKVNVTWFDSMKGFQNEEIIYDVPPRSTLVVKRSTKVETSFDQLRACEETHSFLLSEPDDIIEMPVLQESQLDPSYFGLSKQQINSQLSLSRKNNRGKRMGNQHRASNQEDDNELRHSF